MLLFMKKLRSTDHSPWGNDVYYCGCLYLLFSFIVKFCLGLTLILCCCKTIYSQDILLKNPSLEGSPGENSAPPTWIAINTPDIQPGVYNISKAASSGNTYIGLHSSLNKMEGIAQEVPLKAGRNYQMSFDLAFPDIYYYGACYGDLAVYAANNPLDTTELLWRSGSFYHNDWKRYTASFTPSSNYRYIILLSVVTDPCNKSMYGAALLIDNLSAAIKEEVPQMVFDVTPACKGTNTGAIVTRLTGPVQSCNYYWTPGGQTTSHLSHLAAGTYTVTATALNGAMTTAQMVVGEIELKSTATTISSKCNGDNENEIVINTTGGVPPYRYYLNQEIHASYSSVFNKLVPGNYQVLVEDERGCRYLHNQIHLAEPGPLQVVGIQTKAPSCGETNDGKIFLHAAGGTRPYAYRIENGEWQADSVLRLLNKGRYYFRIKDGNNCEVQDKIDVEENIRECAVFVPTAFSPNNDGQNDCFRTLVHDDIRDFRLAVYGRWGQSVFTATNPESCWNGTLEGRLLPAATYIWVLTYTDSKNQARKQTGSLLLLR
jgi:gliding motility-associated-like protein